jgi:hypothetical protein
VLVDGVGEAHLFLLGDVGFEGSSDLMDKEHQEDDDGCEENRVDVPVPVH